MAKRLTDSEKWEDPWFLELSSEHKLTWIYILDKCDYAGIWKVNKRLIDFCFGHVADIEGFLKACGDKIQVLKNGDKWFIRKFLDFQYGALDERNLMSKRVFPLLEKEGLRKGDLSPLNGVKDVDKYKNKEREALFLGLWIKYPNKAGKTKAQERFERSVKTQDDLEAIHKALTVYLKHLEVNTWKKPQDGKTWFNTWRDWVDFKEGKVPVLAKKEKVFSEDKNCACCNGTGNHAQRPGAKCPFCWK